MCYNSQATHQFFTKYSEAVCSHATLLESQNRDEHDTYISFLLSREQDIS